MKNILSKISGQFVVVGFFLVVLVSGAVYAQDFTQGYGTDDDLLRGSIVSNIKDDKTKVSGSNLDNVKNLLGVVVKAQESAVILSTDTAGVLVTASGKQEVLVSNVNGEVSAGDYITASPIKGVGMRASKHQEMIVGVALDSLDFSKSENILSQTELKNKDGTTKKVSIGRILVEVDVEENPLSKGPLEKAPEIITKVGETLAGKPINPIRIYAAIIILLISLGAGGIILLGGVKTSITAIGRNPLSKKSVLRGLTQVVAVAVIIFIFGFFAVYLLVKV